MPALGSDPSPRLLQAHTVQATGQAAPAVSDRSSGSRFNQLPFPGNAARISQLFAPTTSREAADVSTLAQIIAAWPPMFV